MRSPDVGPAGAAGVRRLNVSTDDFLRDVVGWDVVNWSRAPAFWDRHLPASLEGATALEIGCGRRGGVSLWLAARGARVVCSDHRPPAASARELHARHGLDDAITYETLDARDLPDRYRGRFDVVAYKSVLGGVVRGGSLEDARRVVAGLHGALRPGGVLLLAENLTATPLHRAARRRFGGGARAWRYFTVDEMVALHAPFRTFLYTTGGVLGCFGRTERQRGLLGRLDRRVLDRRVPAGWHYLLAGVART